MSPFVFVYVLNNVVYAAAADRSQVKRAVVIASMSAFSIHFQLILPTYS